MDNIQYYTGNIKMCTNVYKNMRIAGTCANSGYQVLSLPHSNSYSSGQKNMKARDHAIIFMCSSLESCAKCQWLKEVPHWTGLLNPLDCPHHMRIDEESEYREGVVVDRPVKASGKKGSFVECGMRKVNVPSNFCIVSSVLCQQKLIYYQQFSWELTCIYSS